MKILFADDHKLLLESLKMVIGSKFEQAEIVTASNKRELFLQLEQQKFDILIQDVKFGDSDARDFIKDIKKRFPKLRILILTSISYGISIQQLTKKADGYVIKSESIEVILEAIETIARGEYYLSPLTRKKIDSIALEHEIVLTRREKEVLAVIMQERSTQEIAGILCISQKTVEMHRSNLFVKMDVKNLTGLVKKAIALGFLDE